MRFHRCVNGLQWDEESGGGEDKGGVGEVAGCGRGFAAVGAVVLLELRRGRAGAHASDA